MDFVANIKHFYGKAKKDEIDAGREWYLDVHKWAKKQAENLKQEFELTKDLEDITERVIGVTSAISPRMRWDVNKENAIRLIKAVESGEPISSLKLGILANITKGAWIWQAGDYDLLGSMKVWNFYKNIWTPFDSRFVTVDTWAWRVATNRLDDTYNGLTTNQYESLAEAYRTVADEIGSITNQLQAITWLVVRRVSKERVNSIEDSTD